MAFAGRLGGNTAWVQSYPTRMERSGIRQAEGRGEMVITSLHDLYAIGLQELRSAEAMLVEVLPGLSTMASHHQAREILGRYVEAARSHI